MEDSMNNAMKIATGIGVLAGISYFGRRRMASEQLLARGGGAVGYLKGLGQGFGFAVKSAFKFKKFRDTKGI
jgi:hypothetical protein